MTKYPTGEDVTVKFVVSTHIRLGSYSDNLNVFVGERSDDCILGSHFLYITGISDTFTKIISGIQSTVIVIIKFVE